MHNKDKQADESYLQAKVADLKGIPETLLWSLYNRAAEARRPDALIYDPTAIRLADLINYDYARSFGKAESGHVIRALLTDGLLRSWLRDHPGGQVAALGEGLETQFCRVDEGTVNWLAVDLPEAIALRGALLPDTERHHNLACSALDPAWMGDLDPDKPLFVTAVGLLKYFRPDEVRRLVASIAERFPFSEMAFDVMPHALVLLTRLKLYRKGAGYIVPEMRWGLNRDELQTIKAWHGNIVDVTEVPFRGGRGIRYKIIVPVMLRLPWLRNRMFSIVHVRCGAINTSQGNAC